MEGKFVVLFLLFGAFSAMGEPVQNDDGMFKTLLSFSVDSPLLV